MDPQTTGYRARRVAIAAMTVVALACGASAITGSGASANGEVSWRVQDQRVDLTNASSASIRYAIVGRTWMHNALVDWCFGMAMCGEVLAPGATATKSYADISGGEPPEREAIVVWWTPAGTAATPFDTVIVRIR